MKCIAEHVEKRTIKSSSREHTVIMDSQAPLGSNKGMSPGELLLNSIAGCKMLSFTSAARLKKINFSDLSIEIIAEAKDAGIIEEVNIPKKEISKLHIIYRLKTQNSKEEIEECLKLVDELCTVANALSEKIEKTNEIIIVD